jgi:signal transduction histidine kinase
VATLRARLTVAYGFALAGSLIIFAGALYFARTARGLQELGPVALMQGDRALSYLRAAGSQGTPLTREAPDPTGKHGTRVYATEEMRSLLERVPGYFIVYDRDDRQLYSSIGLRQLPDDDRAAIDQAAVRLVPDGEGALVSVGDSLFGGRLLLAARRDPALLPNITRVVAGAPTSLVELSPSLLIGTLLIVFPVILLVSIVAAYLIAGRAIEPVETLINEVEAITDGRSLHRRLPSDLGNEELSRLGSTLNAMIARLETSFSALRRFTADASHELKTPLTVLRADVERAMHPNAAGSEAMQALEEALQETARMADLVDSLLTLARADEGRFDIHREATPLGPVVRDVYETAVILGEHAGLDVSMAVLEEGVVDGDARRLRQPQRREAGALAQLARRRGDRVHRARFGDRHLGRRSAPRVRSLLAGGPGEIARERARGIRAGAGDQPMDRPGAWWAHHGAVAIGPRIGVHGDPAAPLRRGRGCGGPGAPRAAGVARRARGAGYARARRRGRFRRPRGRKSRTSGDRRE